MSRAPSLLLLLALALGAGGCAPDAVFFHESTKLGMTATYNTADSQPLSSHFGYKRRIVAVVPAQERVPSPDGNRSRNTNKGEALSLISKFYVRAGGLNEGTVIRNNFATGEAARLLTRSNGMPASVRALVHGQAVVVPAVADDGGRTAPQMVAARTETVKGRRTDPASVPPARVRARTPTPKVTPPLPRTEAPTVTPPAASREIESPPVTALKPSKRTEAPPPSTREIDGSPAGSTRSEKRTGAPPSATREIDGTPANPTRPANP